jgi:hypothetical protein
MSPPPLSFPPPPQLPCSRLFLQSRYNPSIIRVGSTTSALINDNFLGLDGRVEALVATKLEQLRGDIGRLEQDRLGFHAEVALASISAVGVWVLGEGG